MGYSFDFDDMMQFDGDKLPDKFKMPQLYKFDGTGDPRIRFSQYTTTMSTTKAPMSVVARLFVLSLEGMAVNWYHGLEKSVRANWKELCSIFLKQYEYNTKLEVSIRDLELTKQRSNEFFLNFLTRFKNKAGLMKNKLAEKDQVRMVVRNVSPNLVERLHIMNPKSFVDLYDDGLQVEQIENEKKKNTQSTVTRNYPIGGTQQANTSRAVEV